VANRRALARGSARILAGVIGIAVAGATIGAATVLPLPGFSVTPPSEHVTPVPTEQQRVCPGPLLALAADASASSLSTFGRPALVFGTDDGRIDTHGLKAVDDSDSTASSSPTVLTVPATGGADAPLVAGAQSQTAEQEDLAGFAAAGCGEAVASSWLAAGATDLGQTSLVLLSNPTAVQASVDLTVYSESGMVTAPGGQGILVDPGTQRVVPLAGIAPGAQAPIVHVQATGGRVYASLQQSVVRGIQPGGVELSDATAAPATHQVIAGMTISGAAAPADQGAETPLSTQPALRVVAPGSTEAKVTVGITGEKQGEVGSTTSATVAPGTVQEIPLDHLVEGAFTVTVDSDQPVVVAARTTTSAESGEDFAWFAASSALADKTQLAVAKGPGATLHLANDGKRDATVVVTGKDGKVHKATVKAGSAAGMQLSASGDYLLEGVEGLYGAVSYSGSGQLSSYPLNPPGALARPITVYPR
jgi:hypothetical protein